MKHRVINVSYPNHLWLETGKILVEQVDFHIPFSNLWNLSLKYKILPTGEAKNETIVEFWPEQILQ